MENDLIYVLGAGRSGTTLMDIFIGNSEECASMGEIRKYLDLKGVPVGRIDNSKEKNFWDDVKVALAKNYGYERFFDSSVSRVMSRMESHYSLLYTFLMYLFSSRRLGEYNRLWSSIFSTIREVSGKKVLVDSSKYPGRLLCLLKNKDNRVSVIYIKRNTKDVVKSFSKKGIEQPSKNKFSAYLYCFLMNFSCSLSFFLCRNKKCKIDFNDFVSDPYSVAGSIEKALSLDMSRVKEKLMRGEPLCTGALFEGNRIRLRDTVDIGRPA